MSERQLNIVIKAQNLAGAALKGVQGELKSIQKDIGRGFAKAGRNIERGIGIGVAAAVGGLTYAVKQAGDFEAALNTINTVANLSATDLTAVGDSLRKMARDTGTSLDELTAGYYDLVSAGISAKDAQNVLTQANTLAIGGLGTTAETIDLLTTAINSYGGDASKASEYTNQFAEAIAAGKVTASELAASFAQIGPIAAQAEIGVDELAAGYAVMTATGTPAAEAATQMRAALVALMKPTSELEGIQKDLNVNFLEMAKEKGLAFAYNEIQKAADEAGIEMVELTGRVEGANFAAQVAGPNYERYAAELDKVRNSSDGAGVAAEQMAERQKGLNFQLAKLREQARDAAITIGEAVIPKLVPLMEKASAWIEAHRGDIANFARDVAAAVERGIEWASKLDWEGIGNSLKMAAGFAKGLVEAFLAMPDWVQTAVLTGWGLNKLSGGALGSIIGSVIGGGAKGIFNNLRGATPASPMFTKEVGLGGVGGGAGGGLLGTAAKWILGPAAAVIIGAEIAKGLNESVLGPARDSEAAGIEKVLASRDTASIQAAIDAIDSQLNTGDLAAQTALVASRLPFIGDALGNVAPTLEAQRAALQALLVELGGASPPPVQPPGSGSAAGGGFGPAGSDAAGADATLTQNFGGKVDPLGVKEVVEALARTSEMGLKGIGTSVEEGVARGTDPLGDIATRILAQAEDPKAPEVMNEIQGHLAGLEEIQQTYLNQGDIKLAQKVQANIDTLHDLIGTTDQTRSVTQRMAADAASNDRAMLNSALTQTGKLSAIEGVQRGQSGTLTGILQKKSSVNVNVNATVNVSVAEWQRTAVANARANSNSGGFI